MYFKKYLAVIIVLSSVFLCSGCERAKSIGRGVAETSKGAVASVRKDITGAGAAIIKADQWFRENLW